MHTETQSRTRALVSVAQTVCAEHQPPHLIVVHGDTELVVELERLSPDDSSEPEAVVGVDDLGLRGDIQDVLVFVQRPHILT